MDEVQTTCRPLFEPLNLQENLDSGGIRKGQRRALGVLEPCPPTEIYLPKPMIRANGRSSRVSLIFRAKRPSWRSGSIMRHERDRCIIRNSRSLSETR